MKNKIVPILLLTLLFQAELSAGGISVDAGLTPPQDRFMFRTQYRYMSMHNGLMTMNTHMVPMVLAYGITSGFTLMARGMYVHRADENNSMVNRGVNDLFVLSKFRLLRKNTASYSFGIAPYLASNLPVGSTEISNRTWNPEIGFNISFRPRFFAIDMSTSYVITDISGKLVNNPGNVYMINTAFSALIPFKSNSEFAISPVLEGSYLNQQAGGGNPSNEILFASPGVSFIYSNLALEGLVQLPVYQDKNLGSPDQNARLILGIKYMF
ncbi:MAG: hypothetical protein K9J30_10630 [Bacteroidales bacterium]|nr:hypothetical protein [Bacteroidales bacterium]